MSNGLRLLVCGGRDYSDTARVDEVLGAIHRTRGIGAIIHGGAKGADRLAGWWGANHRVRVLVFEADWNSHGKAAGPIRNKQMIEEGKPDAVVAFPGGRGTANMIGQAKAAGLKVWEL
jgi:hypothetical protein